MLVWSDFHQLPSGGWERINQRKQPTIKVLKVAHCGHLFPHRVSTPSSFRCVRRLVQIHKQRLAVIVAVGNLVQQFALMFLAKRIVFNHL